MAQAEYVCEYYMDLHTKQAPNYGFTTGYFQICCNRINNRKHERSGMLYVSSLLFWQFVLCRLWSVKQHSK